MIIRSIGLGLLLLGVLGTTVLAGNANGQPAILATLASAVCGGLFVVGLLLLAAASDPVFLAAVIAFGG